MNLWDRRPAESGEAYEAFTTYLHLGQQRSLDEAYRTAKGKPQPGTAPGTKTVRASGTWKGWYSDHEWKARAAAWDERDRKIADAARVRLIEKGAEDLATKQHRHETREEQLMERLYGKLAEMLDVALVRRKVVKEDDGRQITIFEPAKFGMKTLFDGLRLYTQLQRMRLAMPWRLEDVAEHVPDDIWHETPGQFEAKAPEGAAHPMPEDVYQKPDLEGARLKAGHGDTPVVPAKARPA